MYVRWLVLRRLFVSRRLLRLLARLLFLYQRSGVERLVRASGLQRLLPRRLHELEPLTPRVQWGSTLGRFHGGLDRGTQLCNAYPSYMHKQWAAAVRPL